MTPDIQAAAREIRNDLRKVIYERVRRNRRLSVQ